MSTFYVDVFDGQNAFYDDIGVDFLSLDEAIDEAASLLPIFAKETLPELQSHSFGTAVRDESGAVVYRAMLLFQGRRTTERDRDHWATLSATGREAAHSAELKAEAEALKDQLTGSVEGLLTTLDDLGANVRASQNARRNRGD